MVIPMAITKKMETCRDKEIEFAFLLHKLLIKRGVYPKPKGFEGLVDQFMQQVKQTITKETK